MQRLFCVKLLPKITRNGSSSSVASSIVPAPLLPSSLLKISANPVHQQSFAQYSAVSRSHVWNLCGYNGFSGRSRHGFFLNPALARRAFANAILKGQKKFAVGVTVRNQGRRNIPSFDSRNRGWLTADGVVIGLIVVNTAIFILWRVASPEFMAKHFMISIDNFTSGRVHTLITAAFSHRDMGHLIVNMVALCLYGFTIGRTFGPEYLLKLYLSAALVSSISYMGYAFVQLFDLSIQRKQMFGVDPSQRPGMGASGAVYGVMLLDVFQFPINTLVNLLLFPTNTLLLDISKRFPAFLIGGCLLVNDFDRILKGDHDILVAARVGGAVVGLVAYARFDYLLQKDLTRLVEDVARLVEYARFQRLLWKDVLRLLRYLARRYY